MFLSTCLWPFNLRVSAAGYAILGSPFLSPTPFDKSLYCFAVWNGIVESDANLISFPWYKTWCFCLDAQTHFPLPLKSGHFNRLTLNIEHSGSIFPAMGCVLSRWWFESFVYTSVLSVFSSWYANYIYLLRFLSPSLTSTVFAWILSISPWSFSFSSFISLVYSLRLVILVFLLISSTFLKIFPIPFLILSGTLSAILSHFWPFLFLICFPSFSSPLLAPFVTVSYIFICLKASVSLHWHVMDAFISEYLRVGFADAPTKTKQIFSPVLFKAYEWAKAFQGSSPPVKGIL